MTIRIVQVGMGGWGRNWTKNVVSRNQDVTLMACVDMDTKTLAQAQQELAIPAERCFTTLEEALASVESDAVLITASLPGHVPTALTALKAGKHVLLEKPFAPTLSEAQCVVDTAAQYQRLLMISQNYRFYPAIPTVTALIREEALGPVGTVHIDFRRYANTAPRDGHRHYTIWQPLLVDMSIHHFDLMRKVLGQEPCQVTCQTWNPGWSNYTEPASGAATITFDGGTVVNYRGSWVSTGPETRWAGEWRMECAGGEIVWTSRHMTLPDEVTIRAMGKRTRHIKLPEMPLIDRHGSLQAFVQAIYTGQEPESSGRDNLKTLALMLASVESSNKG
ncbi:MAG: Gfo/Idh/MocA family oxidoreductase, partial [Chloroflexi bacterium]|nr:Gfo/Idh/MocA family oxidoreductase [Chloroflexota bacterium]